MHRIAPCKTPRRAVPTPQTCQRFIRSLTTSFAQDLRDNGIEGEGLVFSWPQKQTQTIRESVEEQEAEVVAVKERLRKYNEELRARQSMQRLPENDLLKAIRHTGRIKQARELWARLAELEAVSVRVEGKTSAPPELARLNEILGHCLADPTHVVSRKVLWASYTEAKRTIPRLLSAIPEATWNILWTIQATPSPYQDSERSERLDVLLADMNSTSRLPLQGLARIEALCHRGNYEEAIALWEEQRSHASDEGTVYYLQLGIRIYAAAGDPDRAQRVFDELIEAQPNWNARIMIPLLISYNASDGRNPRKANCHHAWALYLLLRQRALDLTRLEYEAIYTSFLNSHQRNLSLAIFTDMLSHADSMEDSTKGLRKQIYFYIRRLQFLSRTAAQINHASLLGLKLMPPYHQTANIYTTWLSKLAKLREGLSAAQVLELMYERGIEISAKQLNIVIRALLKKLQVGDVYQRIAARRRGEELAWFMIQERIDLGWRQRMARTEDLLLTEEPAGHFINGVRIPSFLQRHIPPATIETFNILLRYYTVGKASKQSRTSYVSHLRNVRKSSGVPADVTFLSQLIFRDMRWGHYRAAWKKVKKFSFTVQANSGIYAKLWYGMTLYVDRSKNSWMAGYPPPRALFARMERAFSDPTYSSGMRRNESIARETYNNIISSFCMASDISGTLVALHALKARFGLYPQQSAARAVVKQVARIGLPVPKSYRQKRILERSPVYRRRLAFVVHKLRELNSRRRRAAARGGLLSELSEHDVAEMDLNSISELLRTVLTANTTSPVDAEKSIERAKFEMGVDGINTGDVNCLQIARALQDTRRSRPVARPAEASSQSTMASRSSTYAVGRGG